MIYIPGTSLSISSSVSISHLIHLAPALSPLGHFLIPSAHIQLLPSSIKPHSSYLCLYLLTLAPSIYLPPHPPALRLNPSIQLLPHFPPLCVCFFLGLFESLLMSIHHSLSSLGCMYVFLLGMLHINTSLLSFSFLFSILSILFKSSCIPQHNTMSSSSEYHILGTFSFVHCHNTYPCCIFIRVYAGILKVN